MICPACAEAAVQGLQGEPAHMQLGCYGSGCTCQHAVGTVYALFNFERLSKEQQDDILANSPSTGAVHDSSSTHIQASQTSGQRPTSGVYQPAPSGPNGSKVRTDRNHTHPNS